jgi:hypothetical protein
MEQQYQNGSDEIRTEARGNVLEYIDQFRQSPVISDNETGEDNDDPSDEPPPSPPIVRPDRVRIF